MGGENTRAIHLVGVFQFQSRNQVLEEPNTSEMQKFGTRQGNHTTELKRKGTRSTPEASSKQVKQPNNQTPRNEFIKVRLLEFLISSGSVNLWLIIVSLKFRLAFGICFKTQHNILCFHKKDVLVSQNTEGYN